MANTIKALFKQATVKGGMVVLTFEALTEEPDAFPLIKLSGKKGFLQFHPDQKTFEFDSETGEIIS